MPYDFEGRDHNLDGHGDNGRVKFNEMKAFFDSVCPDTIKTDTPILYESFQIFLEALNAKRDLVTHPNKVLDLLALKESDDIEAAGVDVIKLRDEFTSIYLRNIRDAIHQSVGDFTITAKVNKILDLYGLARYERDEDLIRTEVAITDETIATGKELSQSKGSFRSYDYTFNIMKELDIVKILSTFNEFFLRCHEGAYNERTKEYDLEPFVYSVESSVSSLIFDRVLRNILHPVGFNVVYKTLITSLFEDWYSDKRTMGSLELIISCKGNPKQHITKIKKDANGEFMYYEATRIYEATTITTIKAHLDDAPIMTADGLVYATYIEKHETGDIDIWVGDKLITTLSSRSCILYPKIVWNYEFLLSDSTTHYQDLLNLEYWDKEIHWMSLETDFRLFGDFDYGDAEHYNYNFFVFEYNDVTDYYTTRGLEDVSKLKLITKYKDVSISPEDLVSVRYGLHLARVVVVKTRPKNLNDGWTDLDRFSPVSDYDEFKLGGGFLIGGQNRTYITKTRNGVSRDYWMELDSEWDSDLVFEINISTNQSNGDTLFSGLLYHFVDGTPLTITVECLQHSFLHTNNLVVNTGGATITSGTYTEMVPALIDGNYKVTVEGTNLLGLNMVTSKDFVVNWQD